MAFQVRRGEEGSRPPSPGDGVYVGLDWRGSTKKEECSGRGNNGGGGGGGGGGGVGGRGKESSFVLPRTVEAKLSQLVRGLRQRREDQDQRGSIKYMGNLMCLRFGNLDLVDLLQSLVDVFQGKVYLIEGCYLHLYFMTLQQ